MEEQPTQPFPPRKNQRQASARPRQHRRVLQLLVAFLVVCALIGSMALVLHELQPTSLVWGKTLYTKPLGSVFSNFSCIAWSPNSKRVASLTFNGVQIWDATTGAHLITFTLPGEFGGPQNMAWSPNGKWIAVAAEAGIAIVDAQTGVLAYSDPITSLAATLSVPHGSPLDALLPTSGGGLFVSGLAWSPDSRQLAVTDYSANTGQNNFSIMNAQTGALVHRFSRLTGYILTVASWSPDGKYLAASVRSTNLNDSTETMVWVWDMSTYQTVVEQSTDGGGGSPMPAGEFAWQPKSDNLLFAEGNISTVRDGWEAPTIMLWNVARNKLLKQYTLDNNGIFAWSPDGHYLATGSYANANQIAIIDVQSGQQIYAYDQNDYQATQNDYQVLSVAWSPNGKYLASSDASDVKVWTAP